MGVTVHRPVRALHPHPGPGSGTGTALRCRRRLCTFQPHSARRGVALAGSTARDEGRGTRADPRGRRRGRGYDPKNFDSDSK